MIYKLTDFRWNSQNLGQWRREKRAAARDAAIRAVEHAQREESSVTEKVADKASSGKDTEKDTLPNHSVPFAETAKTVLETEQVEQRNEKKKINVVENPTIPVVEVQDKFFPNESYNTNQTVPPFPTVQLLHQQENWQGLILLLEILFRVRMKVTFWSEWLRALSRKQSVHY